MIKDAKIETVKLRKVRSVLDVVKSNMVECADGSCKYVKPSLRKQQSATEES